MKLYFYFVMLACSLTVVPAQATTVIDFEVVTADGYGSTNLMPSNPGAAPSAPSTFQSGGFSFQGGGLLSRDWPPSAGGVDVENKTGIVSAYQAYGVDYWDFRFFSSTFQQAFSLKSFDIGEHIFRYSQIPTSNNNYVGIPGSPESVKIVGHIASGNQITGATITKEISLKNMFNLDDAVANFQTISFDDDWSSLGWVEFFALTSETRAFSLDNITVDSPYTVPEPAAMLLLGLGLMGLAGVRRKFRS